MAIEERTISADEKKWRAESDARTLKEAEMIRNDKNRLKMAMKFLDDEAKAISDAKQANMEELANKMFDKSMKEEA